MSDRRPSNPKGDEMSDESNENVVGRIMDKAQASGREALFGEDEERA